MRLSEILVAELDAFRQRTGKEKLDIVETGSIRGEGENYQLNDGWSTVTFAEQVKAHGGSLTSIDLDTATADKVLRSKRMRSQVDLVEGHSIEALSRIAAEGSARFDVAFLDSDNDGALIFHEYLVVQHLMRSPGLVVVDDVDINSTGVVKGHQILPWARAHDIAHRLVPREGEDYRTGVLIFEV
jgi:predicted O-methyltransferase YrrM